ncbi:MULTISPECIES: ABC transporter ATP-binding protein [Pyrobaculum]|uniref:Oligopeptide/dipeptide ABC transporter, ATPase subunit n=2 Tax=Pyrobaculum arsenaticum TaxID=121277 RepID=A4WLL7_PYRAR|nr:ABC transporter ATP-binding protein [Pyrobaculum arsenaticum]ABP51284.1 oligopeptide/dipeptide ABC transporter, ATPase subunit [Pyrobaculum arsenaticum DSM 13514]MCY0889489.1 ABC transporter ATP-binding protein [Pyrobaculum arsenaticum]NYR16346.1 ABC transporter ATP-binding protein [Pyrobaculum arsenaticum]
MPPLLELRNVKMYYNTTRGTVKAVDGISFKLEKGEAMALVGESGSGKSSLAFTIIRLLPRNVAESGGEILFYDEELGVVDLMKMSESEIRRKIRWKKISMVFQASMNALNPILRIQDQMIEPLVLHLGMSKESAVKIAEEALRSVGLSRDVLSRYPFELSGGMKQRVVIAMAIMMRPRLVILDEPTSALDVITQANIMNLLKELKAKFDLSYILITHDIALASEIADKIGVMYAGKLVEVAPADLFFRWPKHPYSQKLLAAMPTLREDKKIEHIPGDVPSLINPPPGCRFHPRCPYAIKGKCEKEEPAVKDVEGSLVACWLY